MIHKLIKVILTLFLTTMMLGAHAASFNCNPSNLKRDIERFICNNKTISELDAVMGNRFDAAYQQLSPIHKVDYLKSQKQWLGFWPKSCNPEPATKITFDKHFTDCAEEAYKTRIHELEIQEIKDAWRVFKLTLHTTTIPTDETVKKQYSKVLIHDANYPLIEIGLSDDDQLKEKLINKWIADSFKKTNAKAHTNFYELDMSSSLSTWLSSPSNDLLSLELSYKFESYQAHPGWYSRSLHYSIALRRGISAKDLLKGEWKKFISRKVLQPLNDAYGDPFVTTAQKLEPLISNIDNWTFYKEGIAITFNRYEVAPYSAGNPIVLLPWKKIYPYLTDYAKTQIDSMSNEETIYDEENHFTIK